MGTPVRQAGCVECDRGRAFVRGVDFTANRSTVTNAVQASADNLSHPVGTRAGIIAAAAELIVRGDTEAATTRAVTTAEAVQAPTIYRLFGDKAGLLNAVAEDELARCVENKADREPDADPMADLRLGWDTHIAFGLAHPAIFALISTSVAGQPSPALNAGMNVLREHVRRVARMGRLRVTEERAVDLIHAMGTGTVLTPLERRPEDRAGLSDAARDAVFAAVLREQSSFTDSGPAGAASALRARLDHLAALTPGKRLLLSELLARVASVLHRCGERTL